MTGDPAGRKASSRWRWLGLLDLRGAVVSIDAMGCQKAIAQAIVDAGADYVLTLKDNHPTLCEEVQLWLDTEVGRGHLPVLETVEKDHGRIEIRRSALSHPIDWLAAKPDWAGLQAVGRVESTRIIGEKTSTECRCFLCSLAERDRLAATVRQHWGIENQQHWILDVQFGGRGLSDAQRPLGGKPGPDPSYGPEFVPP